MSCKYGKALFSIDFALVAGSKYSYNLNLLTRFYKIYIISTKISYFASWNTTGFDIRWRLLNIDNLIVAIYALFMFYQKWSSGLTGVTTTKRNNSIFVNIVRSSNISASSTFIVHSTQFTQY